MDLRERIRSWLQSIYFLGRNTVTLAGALTTRSTGLTTVAFGSTISSCPARCILILACCSF
jgi:hypothetical protein